MRTFTFLLVGFVTGILSVGAAGYVGVQALADSNPIVAEVMADPAATVKKYTAALEKYNEVKPQIQDAIDKADGGDAEDLKELAKSLQDIELQ